jgi:hypothetical protein
MPPRQSLTLMLLLLLCAGPAPAAPPQAASAEPWRLAHDASPAFTPDGRTVVFARGEGAARSLYVSYRQGAHWSNPVRAPYSGHWLDYEPAMAPDGSFLVFVSNRPAAPGGQPLDGYWGGQTRPGRGGNLWRVNLRHGTWGTPVRLPDVVNLSSATYSPAVAADGSVYFTHPDPRTHHTRLYVSHYTKGRFLPPQPLPFTDGVTSEYDPAIAQDQSFMVLSSNRPPTPAGHSGLFVAFAGAAGWGSPVPLGLAGTEPRLSPDARTLYYDGDTDERIHRFAIGAWLQRHRPGP